MGTLPVPCFGYTNRLEVSLVSKRLNNSTNAYESSATVLCRFLLDGSPFVTASGVV